MKWNTHQDMENRAYSGILQTLFPEQTKTIPRIIVWSVIFLIDLCLIVVGAVYLGIFQLDSYRSMREMTLPGILLVAALFGVFWLQGFIWYSVANWIKRRNELG